MDGFDITAQLAHIRRIGWRKIMLELKQWKELRESFLLNA
jgi:hypothetical protein